MKKLIIMIMLALICVSAMAEEGSLIIDTSEYDYVASWNIEIQTYICKKHGEIANVMYVANGNRYCTQCWVEFLNKKIGQVKEKK